jgi:hypothetical protein
MTQWLNNCCRSQYSKLWAPRVLTLTVVSRDYIVFTGNYTINRHVQVYGGVMLTEGPRAWGVCDMPPDEVRQDVGMGHLLHFASTAGENAQALVAPMVVQLRSADQFSTNVEDLPEDYCTNTMFALCLVQAPDIREYLPEFAMIVVFRNC